MDASSTRRALNAPLVPSTNERSETDHSATFTFADCGYSVHGSDGKSKTLIQDCTASVSAGEVLAIMGPSGAGKTTLLNMLTLERSGGVPTGRVTLNGHPFTYSLYQKHACYVTQTDQLWPFLTAREHLVHAAAMYQPRSSSAEIGAFVDELLRETGLRECANTKVGNAFFKGLSGGQKRRLSLGVALCKKPSIIFLDEPTSGLDAASAASIMHFLKETALRMRVAIVCTIHQPSSSVFAGFDLVTFLTGGRQAYMGKASELAKYLASVGHPVPAQSNPADFMLDLINRDFSEAATVDELVGHWRTHAPSLKAEAPTALVKCAAHSACTQARVLLGKHLRLVGRDPMLYTGRAVLNAVFVAFFAIIYIKTRERDQEQVVHPLSALLSVSPRAS